MTDQHPRAKPIKRSERPAGPPAETKIDHCLSNIERYGFADGIDWDTEISRAVTVEELLGALVHAEIELQAPRYE